MIFYLMGKSSSGKDTIFARLIKNDTLALETIVSYTTRPIREGELEGVEYHFVNDYEMEEMERKGLVIEKRTYNTVCGVWNYFTAIDTQVNVEKNSYLLIGTLDAYVKIRDYYGNENVIPIYVQVEDGKRLMRALKREMEQHEPKYAEMCRRFVADAEDFSEEKLNKLEIKKRFDNDNIDECIKEIEEYIRDNINVV